MADAPDWPKVLSLTVHEFRTPLTVVAGYLRMLSTDRVGPLSDAQRRVIQEAELSCAAHEPNAGGQGFESPQVHQNSR